MGSKSRARPDRAARRSNSRTDAGAVVVNVTRPVAVVGSPLSAEQGLDAVAALFAASGVEVDVRQLPAGTDAAEGILGVAAETRPEVVVMGLRRRHALGALIIGSTSQRILHGADCPVLAVKAAAG